MEANGCDGHACVCVAGLNPARLMVAQTQCNGITQRSDWSALGRLGRRAPCIKSNVQKFATFELFEDRVQMHELLYEDN